MKILIVTRDLLGPVSNGGIGTACTALAEHMVARGDNVHFLWVPGQWVENHSETNNIAKWIAHYGKKGIVILPLPNPDNTKYSQEGYYFAASHRVYDWCKDKNYDAIIVHEWGGIGGFLAAGRKQGKVKSPVITWCHSPTTWHVMGDSLAGSTELMDLDALEMMSIRWADAVVAPSMYLLDWIGDRGGILPPEHYVVRNFPTEKMMKMGSGYADTIEKIKHVVFFGRLERRKGLHLFCDAILPIMEEYDIDVTFLGKNSNMEGMPSINWIEQRMDEAEKPWRIEPGMDQPEALDFISQPNTLVVMPSIYENYPYTVMEAMTLGVPMVTCNTGGIPEMVKSPIMLADPKAHSIRTKIIAWLEDSQLCIDNVNEDLSEEEDDRLVWTWDRVINSIGEPDRTKLKQNDMLQYDWTASIVIPTYNRPDTLKRALYSAMNQDYDKEMYEIIVVDDHSEEDNANIANDICDRAQEEFEGTIRYIYKDKNEYLGPARNTGVEHASGYWVVFLDDDNILNEDALSTFMLAASNTEADIVVSPLKIFQDVPENVVSEYFFTGELVDGFFQNKLGDAMSMWRKSIFNDIQYTGDRAGHEDWELMVRALLRGNVIFPLVDPIFLYQQSADGMLISGDPVINWRRNMRAWFDEPFVHYSKQLIYEIAFSQPRLVMQQAHHIRWLNSEREKLMQELDNVRKQNTAQNILTPTQYSSMMNNQRR